MTDLAMRGRCRGTSETKISMQRAGVPHRIFAFGTLKAGFPLHEKDLAGIPRLALVRTVRPYDLDAGPFEQLQQAIPRLQKRIAEVEAFDPSKVNPAAPGASVCALKASIDDVLTRTFAHDTVEY